MPGIALSGNDTIQINNRVLVDLGDGDCVDFKFPNTIAKAKIGKNGNAIYSLDTTGQLSEATIRILTGSSDDQYLNGLLNAQQSNFAGTVLQTGQFIKQIGDGQGNITSVTYVNAGGIFTKIPEAKNNAEGDTNQSVTIYTIQFTNQPTVRAIT